MKRFTILLLIVTGFNSITFCITDTSFFAQNSELKTLDMIPMESCLENLNQHHIRLLVEGMINIPEVLLAEFKSYWDDENHYFLFDIPDESVTRDNANLNNRDINSQHSLKIVNEGTGIIKIQDI